MCSPFSLICRIGFLAIALGCNNLWAQLSFERVPVRYSKTEATDAVARLAKRIGTGSEKLTHDAKFGYLESLLTELNIPKSSQTLVFAKNSLQRLKISPENPRAIYFNDETYVGYVPGGDLIEIASTDPQLGSVFYIVDQQTNTEHPELTRKTEQCLFCHASTHTGRVPGLMMQSVFTNTSGHRVFPDTTLFPDSDGSLQYRWAGWFVSGTHGRQRHLGNLMIDTTTSIEETSDLDNGNVTDLSRWFDTGKYLTPHSDLVALLVLQHQTTIHNQLTDANHRTRLLLHEKPLDDEARFTLGEIAEELLEALLMAPPLELSEPVSGTSDFAKEFSRQGPFDSQGRSLRSLDLKTTLFEFPCSYLIYSESFDALPPPLLGEVKSRLRKILDADAVPPKYAHLTKQKRSAIREILNETKPGLL